MVLMVSIVVTCCFIEDDDTNERAKTGYFILLIVYHIAYISVAMWFNYKEKQKLIANRDDLIESGVESLSNNSDIYINYKTAKKLVNGRLAEDGTAYAFTSDERGNPVGERPRKSIRAGKLNDSKILRDKFPDYLVLDGLLVFSQNACNICRLAIEHLRNKEFRMTVVNLSDETDAISLTKGLLSVTGSKTLPKIFYDGVYVSDGESALEKTKEQLEQQFSAAHESVRRNATLYVAGKGESERVLTQI